METDNPEPFVSSLQTLLEADNLVLSNQSRSSAVHDIFEVYTLGLVYKAATDQGLSPRFEGGDSHKGELRFRCGPGKSTSLSHNDFNYVLIPGVLEVHIGLQCKGASGMLHELDLGFFEAGTVVTFEEPHWSEVVAIIECKYHSDNKNASKAEGRVCIGQLADFPFFARELSGLCSNQSHPDLRSYLGHFGATFYNNVAPINAYQSVSTVDGESAFIESVKVSLQMCSHKRFSLHLRGIPLWRPVYASSWPWAP